MSRLLLVLLAVIGVATGGVVSSGADFTAKSTSPTTIGAAADFNTVTVTLGTVSTPLNGPVSLSATAASNRGIANVAFQYAPAGTTDWTNACAADPVAPYTCSWATPSIADGTYDVRAFATDTAGYTRASVQTDRVVNNYPLSVTLEDPGAMSGSEPLTATVSNAGGGGINYLRIEHRAPGATSWIQLCSGNTLTRTCNLDTTALPEGGRELRAVVRDNSNHYAQTTPITRQIDNTEPVTTPNIPPQGSGQVTVSAEATDTGSGIQSVRFDAFYMGQWIPVCTDTTAPYSCTTDSSAVPDGAYQVRVVTTDNAGVSVTGSTYQIVIDNQTPSGTEILASNGTGTAGRIDTGDTVRFTWSEPMAPASIMSGWTGTSQPITVYVESNNGGNDEMYFSGLNLVLSATDLKLGGNFFGSDVSFAATMVQSGNSITVTLGTRTGSSSSTLNNSTMSWRPSANAKDLAGRSSTTTQVNETNDRDF
jgi:chitinase